MILKKKLFICGQLYLSSSAWLGFRCFFSVNREKSRVLYPKRTPNYDGMNNKSSKSNLDVNRLAEINAKMMLKFVTSTSAVVVKILLVVGDSARCQGSCVEF